MRPSLSQLCTSAAPIVQSSNALIGALGRSAEQIGVSDESRQVTTKLAENLVRLRREQESASDVKRAERMLQTNLKMETTMAAAQTARGVADAISALAAYHADVAAALDGAARAADEAARALLEQVHLIPQLWLSFHLVGCDC